MQCKCGRITVVRDSRRQPSGNTQRRRVCLSCGNKFTTVEFIVNMQAKRRLAAESRQHQMELIEDEHSNT